jgi:hypothetical protein
MPQSAAQQTKANSALHKQSHCDITPVVLLLLNPFHVLHVHHTIDKPTVVTIRTLRHQYHTRYFSYCDGNHMRSPSC